MSTKTSPSPTQAPCAQPQEQSTKTYSRRAMLTAGATSLAGLCLGAEDLFAADDTLTHQKIPHLSGIGDVGGMVRGVGQRRQGYVLEVHHRSVYPNTIYPVKGAAAKQMVDTFIKTYTKKSTVADAWGQFVGPGDVVGILVDAIGKQQARVRPAVIKAIALGLIAAGVNANHIIVWTRHGKYLPQVGFKINWTKNGVRAVGADQMGFDARHGFRIKSGLFGQTCAISKIVSRYCTHIINVASLQDHPVIGCRLSLAQQILASYSCSGSFVRKWGGPDIGVISKQTIIRQKFILHMIDGLAGTYDGGLSGWNPQVIMGGTDPVALDRIGFSKIEAARRRTAATLISNSRRNPQYIGLADTNGLGESDLLKIKHQKVFLR
ncbi:MAG: hypothetical protein CL920_02825 [Deltaproteobacteria bacterium]|mgnify:CR=1 FL=1|nr:hypothetical protein [Deltaproteobacteria bacterium]